MSLNVLLGFKGTFNFSEQGIFALGSAGNVVFEGISAIEIPKFAIESLGSLIKKALPTSFGVCSIIQFADNNPAP